VVVHPGLPYQIAFCRQLPLCFNLWCVIYTESDPRGGWWFTSENGGGQTSPGSVLRHLLVGALDDVADKALSAQAIAVTCGINLLMPQERKSVMEALTQ
jgi:hypothetical protein